jgi:hypothetical protein
MSLENADVDVTFAVVHTIGVVRQSLGETVNPMSRECLRDYKYSLD